jgi:Ala-tRNA(Pro) deacylase
MSTAHWIQDELEQRGIDFRPCHHADAYTAQLLAQAEHISGHRVAKVVCVMADGWPVELVLSASRRLDLDWVGQILHARDIRLASEREMEQFFAGCEPGAIPPLRHWQGVDVIMDGNLRVDGDILIQAGTHRDAIVMAFDDWFNLVNPRVELLTER